MNKITVCSPYSILPAFGGGKAKMLNTYSSLARYYDITMVALEQQEIIPIDSRRDICVNFSQRIVPKSRRHLALDLRLMQQYNGLCLFDAALFKHIHATPNFEKAFAETVRSADLVFLASNPYLYPLMKRVIGGKPFIYEAHDVAYTVKSKLLSNRKDRKTARFLRQLWEIEKACCTDAKAILTCSDEDSEAMSQLFQVEKDKFIVAGNGVDTKKIEFVSIEDRLKNKKKLGLEQEKIGVFLGSAHYPNFEACEIIFLIASKCPNSKFFLVGTQCEKFRTKKLPSNVALIGAVSEKLKNALLAVADFSINPIISGSGTNVKMFDYMAAGIPILATSFATRGIEQKSCFIVCEPEELAIAVENFNLCCTRSMIQEARKYTEEVADWNIIVDNTIRPCVERILEQ